MEPDVVDLVRLDVEKTELRRLVVISSLKQRLVDYFLSSVRTEIFDRDETDMAQALDKLVMFLAETPAHLAASTATLARFIQQVLLNENERVPIRNIYLRTFMLFYHDMAILGDSKTPVSLSDCIDHITETNKGLAAISDSIKWYSGDMTKDQILLEELNDRDGQVLMKTNARVMVPLVYLLQESEIVILRLIELRKVAAGITEADAVGNDK